MPVLDNVINVIGKLLSVGALKINNVRKNEANRQNETVKVNDNKSVIKHHNAEIINNDINVKKSLDVDEKKEGKNVI